MHQCPGQTKPLFHAPRKGVYLFVPLGAQLHQLQQVGDDTGDQMFGQPVARGIKGQVLRGRHGVVHTEEVGHVPDQLGQTGPLNDHVHTIDFGPPSVRVGQAGQDAQGRRLTSPVRADETEDIALAHLKGELGEGLGMAVDLPQALGFDHHCPVYGPVHRTTGPSPGLWRKERALRHIR